MRITHYNTCTHVLAGCPADDLNPMLVAPLFLEGHGVAKDKEKASLSVSVEHVITEAAVAHQTTKTKQARICLPLYVPKQRMHSGHAHLNVSTISKGAANY